MTAGKLTAGNLVSRTCMDEQGRTRTFHYRLLVEWLETEDGRCESYGVAVEENGGDSVEISHITTDLLRIHELITLLTEHTVSPTILHDVVMDWL